MKVLKKYEFHQKIINVIVRFMQDKFRQGMKWVPFPMSTEPQNSTVKQVFDELTQTITDEIAQTEFTGQLKEWSIIHAFRKENEKNPSWLGCLKRTQVPPEELYGIAKLSAHSIVYCLSYDLLPTVTNQYMELFGEFKELNTNMWITLQTFLARLNREDGRGQWQIIPSTFSNISGYNRALVTEFKEEIAQRFQDPLYGLKMGNDYRDHHMSEPIRLINKTYLVEGKSAAQVFDHQQLNNIAKKISRQQKINNTRLNLGQSHAYRLTETGSFVQNLVADIAAIVVRKINNSNPEKEIKIFLDNLFSRGPQETVVFPVYQSALVPKPRKKRVLKKKAKDPPVIEPETNAETEPAKVTAPSEVVAANPEPPPPEPTLILGEEDLFGWVLEQYFQACAGLDDEEMAGIGQEIEKRTDVLLKIIANLVKSLGEKDAELAKLRLIIEHAGSVDGLTRMTDVNLKQADLIKKQQLMIKKLNQDLAALKQSGKE